VTLAPSEVLAVVARYYQITPEVLVDARRTHRHPQVFRARCVAARLLRVTLSMSYQEIARVLGRRDHTTASNYVHMGQVIGPRALQELCMQLFKNATPPVEP